MECPHCGSLKYVKNGGYKGVINARVVLIILATKFANLVIKIKSVL